MRYSVSLIYFLTISQIALGQEITTSHPDSLQSYVATVFNLLEQKSLFTKRVNWVALRETINQQIQGAKTLQEIAPILGTLFVNRI